MQYSGDAWVDEARIPSAERLSRTRCRSRSLGTASSAELEEPDELLAARLGDHRAAAGPGRGEQAGRAVAHAVAGHPAGVAGKEGTALAHQLHRRGHLTDPRWREALCSVPRHLFVPHQTWAIPDDPGQAGFRIDAIADPLTWLNAVYSDCSIVIQSDDGAGDPASGQGRFSSSVSAPGAVIQFLELLDPRPRSRILEIGTGSGWTAALLCHAAGDQLVDYSRDRLRGGDSGS